jgi:hypothetical protein
MCEESFVEQSVWETVFVLMRLWANDSVHPARAVNVSISKAPDRGLGCNGWFADFIGNSVVAR